MKATTQTTSPSRNSSHPTAKMNTTLTKTEWPSMSMSQRSPTTLKPPSQSTKRCSPTSGWANRPLKYEMNLISLTKHSSSSADDTRKTKGSLKKWMNPCLRRILPTLSWALGLSIIIRISMRLEILSVIRWICNRYKLMKRTLKSSCLIRNSLIRYSGLGKMCKIAGLCMKTTSVSTRKTLTSNLKLSRINQKCLTGVKSKID